ACGLPVIASPTGGPKEILEQNDNGLLVNVEDPLEIAAGIKKIIADHSLWDRYSANGVLASTHLYSWSSFANKYMEVIDDLWKHKNNSELNFVRKTAYGKKLAAAKVYVISDLDGTLIEGADVTGLAEFSEWLAAHRETVAFGIASGRNRIITQQAIEKYNLPQPDFVICSAGAEIYYTNQYIADKGWDSHIDYQWKREELQEQLTKFPGIRLQETDAQWPFKISYYVNDHFSDDDLANLYKFLDDHKLRAKVLLTDNKFLDFLPFRASKGNAVRYLSYKWHHPLNRIITAGNGGNDKDMLNGKTRSVVVSNYSPELEELRKNKNIYFSGFPVATGVLDGIKFHMTTMEDKHP
ncbi:MAG: HAD-IIB family hydrolase, partial [Chitinophagaceae bacterium]